MSNELNDFTDEISEMLEDSKYKFAFDTLSGIKTTVEKSSTITAGQRRAVRNIKFGGLGHDDPEDPRLPSEKRSDSRRYEGFSK